MRHMMRQTLALLLLSVALMPEVASAFLHGRLRPSFQGRQPATTVRYIPGVNIEEMTSTSSNLKSLYPVISRNKNGTLKVDETHTLYFEEYGNPEGDPALFLHGGPGAGCTPNHARFFDPALFRIILVDQRGSGRSTPRGEWRVNNTLYDLVLDCEKLRQHLGFDHWGTILGGSWGSTLALAYAQEFPERVKSIILRGVCLLRPKEVDWLFSADGGLAKLDPKGWSQFNDAFPHNSQKENHKHAALMAHYDRLLGSDPVERILAAKSWMSREFRVSSLNRSDWNSESPVLVGRFRSWFCDDLCGKEIYLDDLEWFSLTKIDSLRRWTLTPSDQQPVSAKHLSKLRMPEKLNTTCISKEKQKVDPSEAKQFIPAQAMLTSFYSVNSCYALSGIDLLDADRIRKLKSIPCIAIHGALDNVCPVDNALDLKERWPELEVRIPTKSGHSMYDDAITNEIVKATMRVAAMLSNKISKL